MQYQEQYQEDFTDPQGNRQTRTAYRPRQAHGRSDYSSLETFIYSTNLYSTGRAIILDADYILAQFPDRRVARGRYEVIYLTLIHLSTSLLAMASTSVKIRCISALYLTSLSLCHLLAP